ncbi:MAG: hypothetical protein HOP11_10815 [Saprospiraceae bacterium]|nr:hypothetical protein [Saprospiraceae bacterium]
MQYLVIFCITIFTQLHLNAQSAYSTIRSKIDYRISMDSKTWKASKYMGDLTLDDVTENGTMLKATGTFKYKVIGIGTINYTADLKMVLDEIIVKKIYWTQPYTGVLYQIGD